MRNGCYGLIFVATAACSMPDVTFTPPGDAGVRGSRGDAGVGGSRGDAGVGGSRGDAAQADAPQADALLADVPQQCVGSIFRVCFSTSPTKGLAVGAGPAGNPDNFDTLGPDIDTDTDPSGSCDPAEHDACVIAGKGFSVYGELRGHGHRPLVLISTDNEAFHVFAGGVIDVSSRHDGKLGAGAQTTQACQVGGPSSATGQYGGFGGSFFATGGQGGAVGSGEGGIPAPSVKFPDRPQGGCPGGAGGWGAGAGGGYSGSAGGGGGGVVVIVAASVVVDGQINASGAAGGGGLTGGTGGGGGGGSGGLIVIDASSLSGNGSLFANGGGGGQGRAFGVEGNGDDGRESTGPLDPGIGGQNTSSTRIGGHGGNGSSGDFLAGFQGNAAQDASSGGGGGGGGGAGWIKAPGAAATLALSPPAPAS